MCVPLMHRDATKRDIDKVNRTESRLRRAFSNALVDIRKGDATIEVLGDILDEHDGVTNYSVDAYSGKMEFADQLMTMGAHYISGMTSSIENCLMNSDKEYSYVLYFTEASRLHPRWKSTQYTLMDILRDANSDGTDYNVIIADCDMGTADNIAIEMPLIQKFHDSIVVTEDVVAEIQELSNHNLVRCIRTKKLEKFDNPPPERRPICLTCPGNNCSGPTKLDWICPSCRESVCYGWSDEYIYCRCGRYHYSFSEYRCSRKDHGSKYARYSDNLALLNCLKVLNEFKEYNILILGETRAGKSTFVNALINYFQYNSFEEALQSPDPHKIVISFSFEFETEKGDGYVVQGGKESTEENFSPNGQSATQNPKIYHFTLEDRLFRFIDTPGIGDTRGIEQDHQNMHSLLRTLENVEFLNMILFVMRPDQPRLTPAFNFCMTELLCHLHKDLANNIIFGFARSIVTSYTSSESRPPLTAILKRMKTSLRLHHDNQYFFDSAGFRFLAAYKLRGVEMRDKSTAKESWGRSKKAARKMLDHAARLSPQDIDKTLRMNRILAFINNTTVAMVNIGGTIKKNIASLEKKRSELKTLDDKKVDMSQKAVIPWTKLVKEDLGSPQIVCTDPACTGQRNGTGYLVTGAPCHGNCHHVPVNDIEGDMTLVYCTVFHRLPDWTPNAFLKWLFYSPVNVVHKISEVLRTSCQHCGHDLKHHVHLASIARSQVNNKLDYQIKKNIDENMESTKAVQELVNSLEDEIAELEEESNQVLQVQVQFFAYLRNHAMAEYNDATIQYLEQIISAAKATNNREGVQIYLSQKEAYEKERDNWILARNNSSTLESDEEDPKVMLEKLYSMKHNGKMLQDLTSSDSQRNFSPSSPVRVHGRY